MKSKTAFSVICCLLTVLCLFPTACQTSSITVIDAATREPVADAMVFAYCHDFVAFPRQRLYMTGDKGEISFVYQACDSFWIGKPGYYPLHFDPGYPGPQPHGFLFWFTFQPATIQLHPVKTGKRAEVKKARNAYGIIFYHRNPPRESVLLKILQYSHWVYMNTAFYDDTQSREILEEFFRKYSFPVKPEQSL